MSINAIEGTEVIQPFQRLSLSIPIESKKYSFIYLFLSHVLNLSDESEILQQSKSKEEKKERKDIEILPNIAFPYDIWLKEDISIKDIKIKTAMLSEINNMIEKELEESRQVVDDNTLSYYEKLLGAYKFHEIPIRNSFSSSVYIPPELTVREEDDEEADEFNNDDIKSIIRTSSNQSSDNSQKTSLSFGSPSYDSCSHHNNIVQTPTHQSTSTNKRISALTREMKSSRKRLSTLLGHNNESSETLSAHNVQPSPLVEDDHKKQQALNNLLAKSRLYNKLKKHRESSSSLASNISSPSNYSNRNSITTSTTISSASRRRASSNFASPDINESRMISFHSPPLSPFPVLTPAQKQENQRNKYEYYIQLMRLLKSSKKLLSIIDESSKLVKLIEFIKHNILKFIIIDIHQMIISYGQLKAYDSTYT